MIMVDDELQSLEFLVSVTTFYYLELADLRDELPKVVHPKPSEKKIHYTRIN
ncbi:hypothetical protein AWH56_014845 [Anaerobacillus isosaccharinicus]|uniref:Uncharacterized protein n=1 Tax=Anaerobacillus isosaccharinicus TaxID=1532552 RepID=A0A7S7L404_9BACI|nr:hypothetical protein [Anaerobacillus isosaccharinicus]QOY34021.1 hypothetical protein AWH56_014845 [Anaerobacillus isosaccharinicus]